MKRFFIYNIPVGLITIGVLILNHRIRVPGSYASSIWLIASLILIVLPPFWLYFTLRKMKASEPSFASKVNYDQSRSELPDAKIIRAIVRDRATTHATGSLVTWGTLNLLVWYVFHQSRIAELTQLKVEPGRFDTYIYGGVWIAVSMLACGVLGAITRFYWVSLANGILLMVIGLWNCLHDLTLLKAVEEYGYTMKMNSFWVIIGGSQVIWGAEELVRSLHLGFKSVNNDPTAKANALPRLNELINKPASPQTGRLKVKRVRLSIPPFSMFHQEDECSMWLCSDVAYVLDNRLKQFIEFSRASLKGMQFPSTEAVFVETAGAFGITWAMNAEALAVFKEWVRLEESVSRVLKKHSSQNSPVHLQGLTMGDSSKIATFQDPIKGDNSEKYIFCEKKKRNFKGLNE